jgi:hypothetical protein
MCNGQDELGYVVIDVKSSVVRMLEMKVFECADLTMLNQHSHFCADSMMRASVSYGIAVGAYQIASLIPDLEHYFYSLGFIAWDNCLRSQLSNFVKISKC